MLARRGLSALSVLALAVVPACTSGGNGGDQPPDGPPAGGDTITDKVALASSLIDFDECDDLLGYVKKNALETVGPWGLNGSGIVAMEGDVAAAEGRESLSSSDDAAASGGETAAPQQGEDFSGTNVQEEGVDEPDFVKTDGEYLYVVNNDYLEIMDVRGGQPQLLSSTRLDGWDNQLLLDGDRLLVTSQTEGSVKPTMIAPPTPAGGTTLSLYDVSDRANPEEVSSLQLDGSVLSSRLVDGVARVVLRAEPVGLGFEYPEGSGLRAERDATEKNRQVIEESTVDNWVPYYVHTDANGTESEGTLLGCDQVNRPKEFSGLGTTTVMTVDLEGDLQPQGDTSVMAGGDTVYASADRLYFATNQWVNWETLRGDELRRVNENYSTDIHAFDISDPTSASYVGSGNVVGHVFDQWGMSAHEGVLRVATTRGSAWWGERDERRVSESFVTTFGESSDALEQLGQVGGLGETERIYAVRFIGDIGYVVTFRQTDPLYTVDLSDPTSPRVRGELKIMGYSAYLHPVGEGLILGVGQDADRQGQTTGMQLSLFDVSDLSNPTRLHQVALDDTHSEVEWNHHAFLYWPKTGLTVVPFETWGFDASTEKESVTNGAVGYTIDRSAGFVEEGTVSHLPDERSDSNEPDYWDLAWRAAVKRSIVIDDSLVTISDLGVKVSDLSTLEEEAWLDLPHRF